MPSLLRQFSAVPAEQRKAAEAEAREFPVGPCKHTFMVHNLPNSFLLMRGLFYVDTLSLFPRWNICSPSMPPASPGSDASDTRPAHPQPQVSRSHTARSDRKSHRLIPPCTTPRITAWCDATVEETTPRPRVKGGHFEPQACE